MNILPLKSFLQVRDGRLASERPLRQIPRLARFRQHQFLAKVDTIAERQRRARFVSLFTCGSTPSAREHCLWDGSHTGTCTVHAREAALEPVRIVNSEALSATARTLVSSARSGRSTLHASSGHGFERLQELSTTSTKDKASMHNTGALITMKQMGLMSIHPSMLVDRITPPQPGAAAHRSPSSRPSRPSGSRRGYASCRG